MDNVKEFFVNIIYNWLSTSVDSLANTVLSYMEFGQATDATMIQTLVDMLLPISFGLMACYFLIACIREATSSPDNSRDILIRNAIYLVIADLCLANVNMILSIVMSLSNAMMNQVKDAFTAADAVEEITLSKDALGEQTLWGLILLFIIAFISYLLTKAAEVVVGITCLSQKLQLDLKLAWAPIGLASVAEAGMNSSRALNYLKSLFATAFYCAAMVAIMYVAMGVDIGGGTSIADINATTGFGDQVSMILAYSITNIIKPFAAIGAMGIAKTIVNDAFGVNG